MAGKIVLFQFRLASDRSVSPRQLREIWSLASNSAKVSVSRTPRLVGAGFTYSLSGPSDMPNIAAVESRLRILLDKYVEGAAITLARMH
ncbi:hypothetical protein [Tahibacter soli]|jgi:hypothetical protein|uniref:Uncharacterized protein n=1 Tax=Tahibacter soli TaxID=2983605 RepID=A0A9X3YH36_9GAMM|nr:hypothetical protein [Tahibacter soli]MDC8011041.1 hypothetical protein [Tahibacter soli]